MQTHTQWVPDAPSRTHHFGFNWQNLKNPMDFMFLSSFLHSFFGGADKIPFSLRRALVFHTGYSVILKMSCTALIDQ